MRQPSQVDYFFVQCVSLDSPSSVMSREIKKLQMASPKVQMFTSVAFISEYIMN